MLNKKPELFVISAPSGAGKSTLIRELLDEHENFDLSISATTRPPRAGEVNGVHYHFISDDMFSNLIDENEFVEYAQVHHHRYGTLKSHIKNKGFDGTGMHCSNNDDWKTPLNSSQTNHFPNNISETKLFRFNTLLFYRYYNFKRYLRFHKSKIESFENFRNFLRKKLSI